MSESVDHEQHIRGWHARLCAFARQLERSTPDIQCTHCSRPRRDHHYEDLRCTLYACTTKYVAANAAIVKRVGEQILALEHLADVCGWKWEL